MGAPGSRRYYFDFVRLSIVAEFSRDVARNRLGFAWWILEPGLMLAVFYVVFGLVLERGGPGFIYDLLVGVTLWTWFSNTVQRCTTSIQGASQLMQQIYFPKLLLPLVTIASEGLKSAILVVLLLCILAMTNGFSLSWTWLPLLLLLQLLFAGACGIIAALLLPFMNDVKYLVTLVLRLGMFTSGVFFRIDEAVPPEYRDWLMLNPLATLIAEARRSLVAGDTPQLDWLAYCLVVSLGLGLLGVVLLARFDKTYPRLMTR
jgi:lipopolysaccharide transport system permease protein